MRSVIAIDVTTPDGSVTAISPTGEILFGAEFTAERSHNSSLFAPLRSALDVLPTPDCIVVGTGPGSYAGIRVGIAAAHGIGLTLDIPVIGLPSLFGCAIDAGLAADSSIVALGDARRGGLWAMSAEGGRVTRQPEIFEQGAPPSSPPPWITSPHPDLTVTWDDGLSIDPGLLGGTTIRHTAPTARGLARFLHCIGDDTFAHHRDQTALPIYVRAPFITKPTKRGKGK